MHEFLPVQHGDAQFPPRKIIGNRSSNNPAANDHHIERFHANILSAILLSGSSYLSGKRLGHLLPKIPEGKQNGPAHGNPAGFIKLNSLATPP